MTRRATRRPAFTLVEVIVAVAVAGIAAALARTVFEGTATAGGVVARQAARHDAQMNGDRHLRTLLRSIERSAAADAFSGDAASLSFWSQCDVPRGWSERCRVRASLLADARISLALGTGSPVAFEPLRRGGRFIYLETVEPQPRWFDSWPASSTLPLAVGLVGARDTTIIPVGGAP